MKVPIMLYRFETEQWIPIEISRVFAFFANPHNLPRIMPPATGTKLLHLELVPPPGATVTQPDQAIAGVGSEIVTSFRVIPCLPLRKRWTARIVEFDWNHYFADVQQEGPFKSFHHRHELKSEQRDGKAGTIIRDAIDYEIGFGPCDRVANIFVCRQLSKTFRYRQAALSKIFVLG